MRIVFRVPLVVVDAVQDSEQRVLPLPQTVIQSATEFLGHDFSGVSWADGGDRIGVNNPGFHAVHVAVEFDPVRVKVIYR